jgi:NADH-ubiquinone oxidoreductase chain 5
MVTAGVY